MQLSQEGTLKQTGIPHKIENMNTEAKKAFSLIRAIFATVFEQEEPLETYMYLFDILFDILFGLEKGMQQLEEESFEAMRQEGREYD